METAEAEDWWKLIEIAARIVLGPRSSSAGQPDTRSNAQGPTIPPHWTDPAVLKLLGENRRLTVENAELRELVDVFGKLTTELSEFGPTFKEIMKNVRHAVNVANTLVDENVSLKQAADRSANELDAAQKAHSLMSDRVVALERDLADARKSTTPVLHPEWLGEFRLLLHPRMLQHVRDVVVLSAGSAMNRSIENFLHSILRATELGTPALKGSAQEVIDGLAKSGLITPDKYSRKTLSWLTRRTPVVVARAAPEGNIYQVQLDWFVRPPQECLEHFRVRRAGQNL